MTVTMYDSTNPVAIPASAALVGAYVDGFGGYSAAVSRFGASKVVSISVGNNDADVADVETGAMTPGDLPGWIGRQVARGVSRPVVYCNESTWPSVKSAVAGRNVSYWIADPGGSGVISGADAVQNVWEGSWDSSVVQPSFPFYPGGPAPSGPVFPIELGDSSTYVETVQTRLNTWAKLIKLTTPLVVDGAFGALTEAAVKLALVYFDYSAINVALGEVPESLWTHLAATPPPPTPPAPPVWDYLAPAGLHVVSEGYTTVKLAWSPPALGGHPKPDHYVVWIYRDAKLVGSYPRNTTDTTWEGGSLAENTAYVAHVGTSGAGVAHLGKDVFASVSFTTSAPKA